MPGRNRHVVPQNGKWAVRIEGKKRASSLHDTQAEAVEEARMRARRDKSELLIHGRDGENVRGTATAMTPIRRRVDQSGGLAIPDELDGTDNPARR
jgi:hypothetical protein